MTTAVGMITRAMKLAGVIGSGETPSDAESNDCLVSLNSMLDSWALERLFVYSISETSVSWASGTSSRTIGPTGNFVTSTLPVRIDESSYFLNGNISYPVKFINQDDFAAIPNKQTTSTFPFWMYVQYGTTTHTIYAYPIPQSTITFLLRYWSGLQSFSTLTDTLVLPPGYERAIVYSLAEEIAPQFGISVQPQMAKTAMQARKNLKRINSQPPVMASEVGYMNRRRTGNVYADVAD